MLFALVVMCSSYSAFSQGITEFNIPYGYKLPVRNIDGVVSVNLDQAEASAKAINSSFYGADNKGFSKLPSPSLVNQLGLGIVKFGGNLNSTYNWELDAYFDIYTNNISYVYAPLERRLRSVRQTYNAEAAFQVNFLGWQPELGSDGVLSVENTADQNHAANAVRFLNGRKNLGLKYIIVGNEPFLSEFTHNQPIPSADEYIEKFIDYAYAIREAQLEVSGNPNSIEIWGPEIATGWTGFQTNHPNDCTVDYSLPETMSCSYGNGQFSEFIPYFLSRLAEFENDTKANPRGYKLLDKLTLHYYPLFRTNFSDLDSIVVNSNGEQNVEGMLESTNLWDSQNFINRFDSASPKGVAPRIISRFQGWTQQNYPNVKIAVTEFGIDSAEEIAYHPIVRPLYLADMVPRLAKSGIDGFVHSFLQAGSTNFSQWALINGEEKSPLFYTYSLYTRMFKGQVLVSTETYGDEVNSYTVRNGDKINVFLVNKNTKSHNTAVRFARNGVAVQEVAEISLPAWSVTVLSVPTSESSEINVYRYGAQEMGL